MGEETKSVEFQVNAGLRLRSRGRHSWLECRAVNLEVEVDGSAAKGDDAV